MSKRVLYNVFIVFVVVAMMNGTIGCDLGQQSAPVSSQEGALAGALTRSVQPLPSDPVGSEYSVNLDCGRVEIQKKGFLDSGDGMYFNLRTMSDGGGAVDRVLELRTYETVAGLHGYRATLLDAQGRALWEMEQQVAYDNDQYLWTSEKTPFDELIIEQFRTDTSITEVYTQNGQTEVFYFPTADGDLVKSLHAELIDGKGGIPGKTLGDPQLGGALSTELIRFDNFYNANSSLNYNHDGDLTVDFITNQGVADWLTLEYPDTTGGQVVTWIPDWVCIAAGRCIIAKCPFGGAANGLCDVCVGVAVACVVERVIGSFT